MPQVKFPDGSVMVCGNATRDAELKIVGEKKTPNCKIGLAIGKHKDTTTIFVNVVAWRGLAHVLANVRKGDAVAVWGRMTEPREYNGKTYQDLQADWVGVASDGGSAIPPIPRQEPPAQTGFADLPGDSAELPF